MVVHCTLTIEFPTLQVGYFSDLPLHDRG